ncbi:aminotransferase [Salisediminibacterium halotolerans]|uniref:Aminotransferase n=1 Tax=Salisediminibacterium halotolerans TaxID=517425 RepID=A0A1H9UUX6_9BACI|nr:aminotransferase [Salisediminibacterium haloalkalitolerans]SES13151.1 aminotransferase [Salisediminibacterium haloalkalitolerans]
MKTANTTHQPKLSQAVNSIEPSGIRRFFDLAASMDNIISLGVGEPDYSTPWNVREASIHSLERGLTAYTANAGLPELRKSISRYLLERFQLEYDAGNEVVVTVGASEGIDLALRSIVDPGDEVLVVEPCFVSYAPLVSLAGGTPVSVPTSIEADFMVEPDLLAEKVTEKTKAVMLSFPNNPTGAVMDNETMQRVAEVCIDNDLIVISDEIYAELSYDCDHQSVPILPGMHERTILISGFSKSFAMTGWRIGYVCAPQMYAEAMLKIHQYGMMCASTMAQYAALEALENGKDVMEEMIISYRQRRNYFVESLKESGLECHTPGGAFYAFPSIKKTGLTSAEFAERLLLEERVAVVPGSVFGEGGEGHVRCSYAASMAQLEEATERIGRFVAKYLSADVESR